MDEQQAIKGKHLSSSQWSAFSAAVTYMIYHLSLIEYQTEFHLENSLGGIGLCVNTLPWALNERCGKHMVPLGTGKKKNQKKTKHIVIFIYTGIYRTTLLRISQCLQTKALLKFNMSIRHKLFFPHTVDPVSQEEKQQQQILNFSLHLNVQPQQPDV